MEKAIPLGTINFERLRQEKFYFIDKSLMIRDFIERGNAVTLITRPRRFGKTINMSMMASFFDITKDSKDLFQGTKIMETEYASEMNQYPTVFLSFANAKKDQFTIVQQIKEQLQNEYDRYQHTFKDLNEFDESNYKRIKEELLNTDNENFIKLGSVLSFLMKILEKYYGKKVMVFIDEYDTPFIEAHVGGFYDEIRSGLAGMLHNALKTSPSLQYAMMTGIQRVAKENIFSDLNNLVVCTVKDPEYAQYFGFTEEETEEMLQYYDLSLNEEVKKMYDGYHFGSYEIYNPWSVLNYASRKVLEPYWVNTSSNQMIKSAMASSDASFQRGYEKLIQTGTLEALVNMGTSFYEVNSTPSLWGLLVNAGYLTIEKVVSVIRERYVLRIPNEEVKKEFQSLTSYYLKVSDDSLDNMFESLRNEELENFTEFYQKILLTLPSYHDLKDENSYHMMLLGMCAWLSSDYEIISNRETGKGRCDILLKAKDEKEPSFVLEFKYTKDTKQDLKELAQEAIKQIKERRYDVDLRGKVTYIGLAHCNKEVEIAWEEQ